MPACAIYKEARESRAYHSIRLMFGDITTLLKNYWLRRAFDDLAGKTSRAQQVEDPAEGARQIHAARMEFMTTLDNILEEAKQETDKKKRAEPGVAQEEEEGEGGAGPAPKKARQDGSQAAEGAPVMAGAPALAPAPAGAPAGDAHAIVAPPAAPVDPAAGGAAAIPAIIVGMHALAPADPAAAPLAPGMHALAPADPAAPVIIIDDE